MIISPILNDRIGPNRRPCQYDRRPISALSANSYLRSSTSGFASMQSSRSAPRNACVGWFSVPPLPPKTRMHASTRTHSVGNLDGADLRKGADKIAAVMAGRTYLTLRRRDLSAANGVTVDGWTFRPYGQNSLAARFLDLLYDRTNELIE